MSTHCGIGIKRKNGAVDATYCHFDGYLDGVGENLKNFFRDADKVSNLVSMGDLRGISDSGEVEVFDDEVGFDDKHFRSVEEFLQSDLGTLEYTYLFDEDTNRWYFLGGEDPETDIFDDSLGMYHLDGESLEEDDKSTKEISNSLYDKLDEHSLKDLVADNDSEAMRKLINYCENFGTNEVWEETLKQLLKYVPEDVIENYIHYELNDLVSDEASESITDDYFDFHNGNY